MVILCYLRKIALYQTRFVCDAVADDDHNMVRLTIKIDVDVITMITAGRCGRVDDLHIKIDL